MPTPAIKAGRIVVMGVAGCGKSTLGAVLAEALERPFIEGDDLHSPESRAKMAAGIPLTDADRWPWLDRVGAVLARQEGVIACSALKRVYRDRIRARAGLPVIFLHLAVPEERITARLEVRRGHYFDPVLQASQQAILEPPGADETGFSINADRPLEEALQMVLERLSQGFTDFPTTSRTA
jgi:gluconokinase